MPSNCTAPTTAFPPPSPDTDHDVELSGGQEGGGVVNRQLPVAGAQDVAGRDQSSGFGGHL